MTAAPIANFLFRLGCTLLGLAGAHAVAAAASLTNPAFPDFLIAGVIGFCCGWWSRSDG